MREFSRTQRSLVGLVGECGVEGGSGRGKGSD